MFLSLREETRGELAALVARDGLRSVARACKCHPAVIVDGLDGLRVELRARQAIVDFCSKAHKHGYDYQPRAEGAPVLPSVRLRDYMTDDVSRAVAQGYLALAGNKTVAAGPEPYVPGSGGPIPSMSAPPDRSAPSGVAARLARISAPVAQ